MTHITECLNISLKWQHWKLCTYVYIWHLNEIITIRSNFWKYYDEQHRIGYKFVLVTILRESISFASHSTTNKLFSKPVYKKNRNRLYKTLNKTGTIKSMSDVEIYMYIYIRNSFVISKKKCGLKINWLLLIKEHSIKPERLSKKVDKFSRENTSLTGLIFNSFQHSDGNPTLNRTSKSE